MDQVKVVLAGVKKYHFWVLCGITVLVALGIWHTATSQLSGKTSERKSKLDSTYKEMKQLGSDASPANEKTVELWKKGHGAMTESVFQAWGKLYEAQTRMNQWPNLAAGQFRAIIKALKPDQEIPPTYREVYQNFIAKYLPELFIFVETRMTQDERQDYLDRMKTGKRPSKKTDKKGDAKRDPQAPAPKDGKTGGTTADGSKAKEPGPSESQFTGIVDWDPADRSRLEGRFYWERLPTTLQVRVAQEDLWVYEALLRIIKATNGPATGQHNAPVKRIITLAIGSEAAPQFAAMQGRASGGGMGMGAGYPTGSGGGSGMGMMPAGYGAQPPAGASGGSASGGGSAGGASGSGGRPPTGGSSSAPSSSSSGGAGSPDGPSTAVLPPSGGMSGMGPMGMGMGGGMMGMMGASLEPRHLRYVDQTGNPLTADAKHPFAEFKMMPVHMALVVDQRAIPKLLAECGNSSMPVVVRRVSIQPEGGSQGSFGTGGGMPMGAGRGMGMGMGMGTGMGMSMGSTSGMGLGAGSPDSPNSGSSSMGKMPSMGAMPPMGGMMKGYGSGMGARMSSPDGGAAGLGGAYRAGGGTSPEESSMELTVEIQGIIYIFNPPPPDSKALEAGLPNPPVASPAGTGGSAAPSATGMPVQGS